MTIGILGWVVFTFVRWVDQIARLGRVGTTIERVEKAAETAIEQRRRLPNLGALPVVDDGDPGEPLYAGTIGYVERIDVDELQKCAEKNDFVVKVAALQGTFVGPGRALAYVKQGPASTRIGQSIIRQGFHHRAEQKFRRGPTIRLVALAKSPRVPCHRPSTTPALRSASSGVSCACWTSGLRRRRNRTRRSRQSSIACVFRYCLWRTCWMTLLRLSRATEQGISKSSSGSRRPLFHSRPSIMPNSGSAARHHSERALARSELALKLPYELDRAHALASKVT